MCLSMVENCRLASRLLRTDTVMRARKKREKATLRTETSWWSMLVLMAERIFSTYRGFFSFSI